MSTDNINALVAEARLLLDVFSDAAEQEGRDYIAKGGNSNWREPTFTAYNNVVAAIERLAQMARAGHEW
jgi:hypothetical protein